MLMTKVNCCCCAGVVVVAPWCCCFLLLLLAGIPDSDKNVSLRPPTATPHSDGMFSQRLMRRMRNVKAMARGKQRGGIVRFSMYIHLYTHTHIRLSQSQGVSRLHELIDTGIGGIGGIGGNKMCLPNNFICEKWHSWNIHAGKKKKNPAHCDANAVSPEELLPLRISVYPGQSLELTSRGIRIYWAARRSGWKLKSAVQSPIVAIRWQNCSERQPSSA